MSFGRKISFYGIFCLFMFLYYPSFSFAATSDPTTASPSTSVDSLSTAASSTDPSATSGGTTTSSTSPSTASGGTTTPSTSPSTASGGTTTPSTSPSTTSGGTTTPSTSPSTTSGGASTSSTNTLATSASSTTLNQGTSATGTTTAVPAPPQFTATDRYFQVTGDQVPVYDRSSGTQKQVGYIQKGQIYTRVADYGDWHQIKFGSGYGYVLKASTIPADGSSITDLNSGLTNSSQNFTTIQDLTVYDNSTGSLVPFATLLSGIQYPFISDQGNMYKIDVAGRIGYVYKTGTKLPFQLSDKYFSVYTDNVSVYDNSSGSLKFVGTLVKGQIYPRISGGDWQQIKFGNGYGYVWADATAPANGSTLKDLNPGMSNSVRTFTPNTTITVYDNSSGSLVPFANLAQGIQYPFISDTGDWLLVDVGGRIGYVYKAATSVSFLPSDRYFQANQDNVSVYDNSSGSLKFVGTLVKGQVYQRISGGDWQQIKLGNGYGYVWAAATVPATGNTPKNLNSGMSNSSRTFTPNTTVTVYDNSNGSLVPFVNLAKDVQYPLISDTGDWLLVDVDGRIGYVYKAATSVSFLPSDRYFQVNQDSVTVYDNSSGSLQAVGTLVKGQIFPRIGDYGSDWQQIKFGNGYGYIWKAATNPANGNTIQDLNTNLQNSNIYIKPSQDIAVYDNSSGALVPFAYLLKDKQYPIIGNLGSDWYQVDVSGRIGYIYKPATTRDFSPSDKYFQVKDQNVPIYDNNSVSAVIIGYLDSGEVFPRVSDFGDWHQIKFGNKYGYVLKAATTVPNTVALKNENTSYSNNPSLTFTALQNLTVYDNTSGSLVPFATINQNDVYPAISILGDWVKVDVSGRVGYVTKGAVQIGPIYNYTSYNLTLDQMLAKQLSVYNATDKKYNVYVRSDALMVNDPNNPTFGTVVAPDWGVHGGPGTSYWTVGILNNQEKVTILNKVYNSQDGYWWYQINFNRTWVTPNPDDVKYYLNPANFSQNSDDYYQFLSLSKPAGVDAQEVNDKILAGKGILTGEAAAFISAANSYNINEMYLISHALLETGYGASQLANGVLVTQVNGVSVAPKTVYNMYGIHAYDASPVQSASEYAYQQGWFTPEAAIIGGAKWISDNYIHDPKDPQDTLYKMRFNPAFPATYNYASDIAWADKQTPNISSLYKLLSTYVLTYDIPVYA